MHNDIYDIFGAIPAAPGEPVADDTPHAEDDLRAENARLRAEVRRLHREIEAIGDNNAAAYTTARDVRAENARLRAACERLACALSRLATGGDQ